MREVVSYISVRHYIVQKNPDSRSVLTAYCLLQDAALEQQTTVVAAKRKLAVEFARRRKALEAEARM